MQEDPDRLSAQTRGLLDAGRELLTYADASTAGRWPLAVSLLTRQGLEATLDSFWARRVPAVAGASMRAQLLCLRELGDEESAELASDLWGLLSGACHHHPYDLSPTAGELLSWIEGVEDLARRLQAAEVSA